MFVFPSMFGLSVWPLDRADRGSRPFTVRQVKNQAKYSHKLTERLDSTKIHCAWKIRHRLSATFAPALRSRSALGVPQHEIPLKTIAAELGVSVSRLVSAWELAAVSTGDHFQALVIYHRRPALQTLLHHGGANCVPVQCQLALLQTIPSSVCLSRLFHFKWKMNLLF